jgi:hypothetical protein
MESVDILHRIDGRDDHFCESICSAAAAAQDAMDGGSRSGVPPGQQLGLARRRRQAVIERPHAAADVISSCCRRRLSLAGLLADVVPPPGRARCRDSRRQPVHREPATPCHAESPPRNRLGRY